MMQSTNIRRTRKQLKAASANMRLGAAVPEFALLLPVLALITFGAIDTGQLIDVSRIVNEASREGARLAVRSSTTDTASVESAVIDYIGGAFGNTSIDSMSSSIDVEIRHGQGSAIPGGNLSDIDPGTAITVGVTLPFSSVRYMPFVPGLGGIAIETETVMRRE